MAENKGFNYLLLVPLIIFLGIVIAAVAALDERRRATEQGLDPNELPSVRVGQPAPAMNVEPLAALPAFDAEALAAPGVKLVNFWASWCAPCRVEHPNIQRLADEGIPVYGINYKDDPAKALAFLEELGNPYAGVVADSSGRTGIDWGLYGVPETFVIDGEGNVVLRFAGPVTERSLESKVRPAIEAAK